MALNSSIVQPATLISVQMSFSTADIERTMFFDQEIATPVGAGESIEPTSVLVVHGDMFTLEQSDLPGSAARLAPSSGLFRIAGLEQEAAH
jgi:hypothetical protein